MANRGSCFTYYLSMNSHMLCSNLEFYCFEVDKYNFNLVNFS